MHGAIHTDTIRVIGGSATALIVSYTCLRDVLAIAVLVLNCVWLILKIWKTVTPKAPINDTDPPIK